MVTFNNGPTRWDAGGYDYGLFCMPHLSFLSSPSYTERYFTSGNERTPLEFNPHGKNMSYGTGYHLRPEDKFWYAVELMNMNMEDQLVYLTMTYDIIEGPLPRGWNEVKPIWLDANQCGNSEVPAPQQTGAYSIQGKPWKPNFDGKVISLLGHLHDGGIEIDINAGPEATLCKTSANYGERNEYIFTKGEMMGDRVAREHISSMSGCSPEEIKSSEYNMLRKDQEWTMKGFFNYDAREGNLESGKQSEVSSVSDLYLLSR
jgi:hypothetical protein